jgi:hypothetical protein
MSHDRSCPVYGRVVKMKGHFPLVRISPLGITNIFQSSNSLSSKAVYVHALASGQDIQKVLPCTTGKRSDHQIPVIMRRPLKFIQFLPRRHPHCLMMVLIGQRTSTTQRQSTGSGSWRLHGFPAFVICFQQSPYVWPFVPPSMYRRPIADGSISFPKAWSNSFAPSQS